MTLMETSTEPTDVFRLNSFKCLMVSLRGDELDGIEWKIEKRANEFVDIFVKYDFAWI